MTFGAHKACNPPWPSLIQPMEGVFLLNQALLHGVVHAEGTFKNLIGTL